MGADLSPAIDNSKVQWTTAPWADILRSDAAQTRRGSAGGGHGPARHCEILSRNRDSHKATRGWSKAAPATLERILNNTRPKCLEVT